MLLNILLLLHSFKQRYFKEIFLWTLVINVQFNSKAIFPNEVTCRCYLGKARYLLLSFSFCIVKYSFVLGRRAFRSYSATPNCYTFYKYSHWPLGYWLFWLHLLICDFNFLKWDLEFWLLILICHQLNVGLEQGLMLRVPLLRTWVCFPAPMLGSSQPPVPEDDALGSLQTLCTCGTHKLT